MDTLKYKSEYANSNINIMYQSGIKNTYKIHKHEFYEIFIVINGSAVHSYNNNNYLIKTGDIVFMSPDDFHEYLVYNEDKFEMLNFSCSIKEFEDICSFLGVSEKKLVNPNTHNCISVDNKKLSSIQELGKEVFNYKFKDFEKDYCISLKLLFSEILSLFYKHQLESYVPFKITNIVEKMSQLENLVEGNKKMIELSGFSQTHLNRLLKKYYNMSSTNLITDLRLEKSLEMILNTNLKVIDIANIVGFNNLSYFNRSFKDKYGYTPSQIRNYNNNV